MTDHLDQENDMTDNYEIAKSLAEYATGNSPIPAPSWEGSMANTSAASAHALLAIHDVLAEIRDRLPERVEARVTPFDPDVIAANIAAIKHETETPTREHGECCEPAPADVDPDEAIADAHVWHIQFTKEKAGREKAEAEVERLTRERDAWQDVAKGAGSRANSEATHRAAAEAERDEWKSRHAALRAAGRALTDEWHDRFMALPDATKRHADVLSDCTTQLGDILDRADERGEQA